jgi:predicted DNA-binding transcriptional regulator YafY
MLSRRTDEDNPLSTEQILDLLSASGISTERRALLRDVELLNRHGYEIKSFKRHSHYFYVADRPFDIPELRVLIDAVQAASFIPETQTKRLIDRIADLAGAHRAELLKKNIVCFDTAKHSNKYVLYTIDALTSAIEQRKKASFLYFGLAPDRGKVYRKSGGRYLVNPLALIYTDDEYYLTCYSDKYRDLCNYRIDRMERVEVETAAIAPAPEYENFNINAYKRQAFSMFGGELKEVTLTVADACLDAILDKFGEQVPLTRIETPADKVTVPADISKTPTARYFRVTVPVQVSPTFYAWCLTSFGQIKITAPDDVVRGFREYRERVIAASAE